MVKKILIVDDEKEMVDMLEERLTAEGFEVFTAGDGQSGLIKTRDGSPDLVILDVMMPKMDGFNVCRMLKFDDETKGIPIILLTARDQSIDKKLGENVKADAYMTKPFNPQELIEKVEELIDE